MGYEYGQHIAQVPFVSGMIVWHIRREACAIDPILRDKLGLLVTSGLNECTASAYAGRIHPDDLAGAVQTAIQCRLTRNPYRTAYRLLDRNGDVFPVQQSGWWICEDNEPISLMSMITNDHSADGRIAHPPFEEAIGLTTRIQKIGVDQGWRDVEYLASITRLEVGRIHREHMRLHSFG